MKNSFLFLVLVAVILTAPLSSHAAFYGSIQNFSTTGRPGESTSENVDSSQNIMNYVVSRGAIVPATDITQTTSALDPRQFIWFGDIVSSIRMNYLGLWNGTNNSTAFPQAAGRRLARALDITNSTPFYATSLWYKVWSSDPQNALSFLGRFGETSTRTTFHPALRGELFENGVLRVFQGGEDLRTQKVTRVTLLLRYGYVATNDARLLLTQDYHMAHLGNGWTNTVAFYISQDGVNVQYGVTNALRNPHHMASKPAGAMVLGEYSSVTYAVERSTNLVTWQQVTNGVIQGYVAPLTGSGMQSWRSRRDTSLSVTNQAKNLLAPGEKFVPLAVLD